METLIIEGQEYLIDLIGLVAINVATQVVLNFDELTSAARNIIVETLY